MQILVILNLFRPFVIETLGVWGPGAAELAASIGRRIIEITEDTLTILQKIDLAVQRGNALSILGTLAASEPRTDELHFCQ